MALSFPEESLFIAVCPIYGTTNDQNRHDQNRTSQANMLRRAASITQK
ncbi:MAG: hypothetical protein ACK5R5_03465 [Alphaproteobacteria bacterium]